LASAGNNNRANATANKGKLFDTHFEDKNTKLKVEILIKRLPVLIN
jgi:hypothetical protein